MAIQPQVADQIAHGAGRLGAQPRKVFRVGNLLELVEERILHEARQLHASGATGLVDGALEAAVDPHGDLRECNVLTVSGVGA